MPCLKLAVLFSSVKIPELENSVNDSFIRGKLTSYCRMCMRKLQWAMHGICNALDQAKYESTGLKGIADRF